MEVTSDIIFVCATFTVQFLFFSASIELLPTSRGEGGEGSNGLATGEMMGGLTLRSKAARSGLNTPSSGQSGSTELLPEMINPSSEQETSRHWLPFPRRPPPYLLLSYRSGL